MDHEEDFVPLFRVRDSAGINILQMLEFAMGPFPQTLMLDVLAAAELSTKMIVPSLFGENREKVSASRLCAIGVR